MSIVLTELNTEHGFTVGDLDTSGWFATIPAYQEVFFADGRKTGYHRLDMYRTKLTGSASGAFIIGEILEQATTGAKGIFHLSVGDDHYVYRITTTEFNTSYVITGADSGETVTPSSVTAPPHWLTWEETPGKEGLPESGANAGCLCFGRIFLNDVGHANQWFTSRAGDPFDWLVGQSDIQTPISSQTSKAGLVASPLIGFVPYQDHYLLFGLIDSWWVMRSDPRAGGTLTRLTSAIGMLSPTAFCWDEKDNLFILGFDGIYYLPATGIINAQPPINITKGKMPRLFHDMAINKNTDNISMEYDKDRYGIRIAVTQKDGEWEASFWIDLRSGNVEEEGASIFPETFNKEHRAHSLLYYKSQAIKDRKLLIGCDDGYIRSYDDDAKSDDSEPIDAFYTIGPFISEQIRGSVKHDETLIELDPGSDGVNVGIYSAKTAQEIIDNIDNGKTAKVNKEIASNNMLHSIREKVRNGAIAVKIGNNNVEETFIVDTVSINVRDSGRLN